MLLDGSKIHEFGSIRKIVQFGWLQEAQHDEKDSCHEANHNLHGDENHSNLVDQLVLKLSSSSCPNKNAIEYQ